MTARKQSGSLELPLEFTDDRTDCHLDSGRCDGSARLACVAPRSLRSNFLDPSVTRLLGVRCIRSVSRGSAGASPSRIINVVSKSSGIGPARCRSLHRKTVTHQHAPFAGQSVDAGRFVAHYSIVEGTDIPIPNIVAHNDRDVWFPVIRMCCHINLWDVAWTDAELPVALTCSRLPWLASECQDNTVVEIPADRTPQRL